jgi:hypothetical protein
MKVVVMPMKIKKTSHLSKGKYSGKNATSTANSDYAK